MEKDFGKGIIVKIYTIEADVDNYWYAFPKNIDREDFWRQFDGRSLINRWSEPVFEWYKGENDDRKLPIQKYGKGDIQGYQSHIPLLSSKSVDCLGEILSKSGEILKIKLLDEDYFLYNITSVINALDLEHSEVKYFRDSDRIMRIKKYEFKENMLKGINIFKLQGAKYKTPFVTEKFIAAVEECGLEGFKFRLVWEG